MATKKEIDEHLKKALAEIGKITPIFDDEVGEWVFSSNLYPVEYAGDSEEEVIKNYPRYLREFIKHRLNNRLHPLVESKTKGHGGRRSGAGRPKGSKKTNTRVRRIPADVADWIDKTPSAFNQVRRLIAKSKL